MGRRSRAMLAMRRVMGLEALERVEARRRAAEADTAGRADTAAQAAAHVDELRRRMAELATAIKALEERAQQLGAGKTAEDAADDTRAAAGSTNAAADAERQVEAIDALLDGVRRMRAALEQQREELARAEERVQDDEHDRTARASDITTPHNNKGGA